ncbi:TIGR03087 family PEP-CTERM/XrtA system glycosyltransferase [Hyphococcus sp.]|uniref:TIGR03087 family PEP-CTERM/XrtA system glycosyltransferase n=1 Tax=Hyphococcus sp. TaxID=2038636 RepID=UPI0035C720B0
MKPEVLFLAHRIPYPPDKGDKIRSWRLLAFLAERYRVHLACFADDPRDLSHQAFLETLCESATIIPLNPRTARIQSIAGLFSGAPLSFRYFHHAKLAAAVRELRKKPLAAEIVFSSSMAPYIENPVVGRKRLVDFCDADAEKWRGYAQDAKGPIKNLYAREARTLAHMETQIVNWADASFAISEEEAAIFNARENTAKKVAWFSNGVDTVFFDPYASGIADAPAHDCVFTGAMDYRANVDGVLDFMKSIWPALRKGKPDASFAIVGANPASSIKALDGKDGVTVTGRVDDIRPWLAGAKIAVAPLRVARGLQNKVLEAMAMAKPVIASPEAMTGIAAPRDAAVIASSDEAAASSILALLNDIEAREHMGRAARHFVLSRHQWDEALKPLEEKLKALGL